MNNPQRTDVIAPAPGWGARVFRLRTRLGLPRQDGDRFLGNIASTLGPLLETMLIIAACEGAIMWVLPFFLPSLSTRLALAMDITLLALTTGPLLWWRFSRHYRLQDARRRLEIEQRTAELRQVNAKLMNEVGERERAEQAVRQNVTQLQTIVENLAEGVVVSDLAGQLLHFNRAALTMHGFGSLQEARSHLTELVGIFELSEMNGPALPLDRWPLSRVLRGENLRDLEVRVRRPEAGWERLFSYGGSLVRDPDGRPMMAVVTVSDITERKRQEAELHRAQSFLNSVIENLPIPVFIKEAKELRFVLWNKAGEQLTGIPSAEMIGKNDYDFFPPADADRNVAKDRAAFAKQGVLEIPEEIIQTRQHGARTVHVWKVPIPDATGQPAFLLGICEDITDHQQAAAALAESEERFRSLVENSPDMIGIYQNGKLVFINATGIQLWGGKTKEDLLGRPSAQMIHPDDLADAKDRLQRRLAGETGMYPAVVRYVRLDGTIFSVEVSAVSITFGGQPAVQFVAHDITERQRAVARLAESEDRFRSLVEDSPDMIGIYQAEHLVFLNPTGARLLGGSTPAEFIGRTRQQLIHPDDFAGSRDRHQRRLAGEPGMYPVVVRYMHRNGTMVSMEVSAAPVTFAGQPALQFVARDITERKQAEAKLAQTQRELVESSRLAGMAEVATGVLHNVGNVLNSVNVAATCLAVGLRKSKAPNLAKVVALLREHDADLGSFFANDPKGKQVPGYLAQLADHLAREQAAAQKETADLQSHIEHIKEIVTAQQSFANVVGVTEVLNVTALVEDALRLNESSLTHHGLRIVREFAVVPPIAVEKHKVLQILVNLVQNAKQACQTARRELADTADRDEKQMTLRIMNGGDRVRISVRDNGVGIPPENLTRIFNHGFTTKKNGHGFGLHNAVNAAREMGGDLKVHSDGPGQGATFTLELPVSASSRRAVPSLERAL